MKFDFNRSSNSEIMIVSNEDFHGEFGSDIGNVLRGYGLEADGVLAWQGGSHEELVVRLVLFADDGVTGGVTNSNHQLEGNVGHGLLGIDVNEDGLVFNQKYRLFGQLFDETLVTHALQDDSHQA